MTQTCPHCQANNRDTARFCAQCAQPLRQICPRCGADQAARSHFCSQCGTSLEQEPQCPQCGQVNPTGSRFCNACGAVLLPTGPQPPPAAPAYPPTATGTGQLPPQTLLAGRYIILRRIGKGGMGSVYQAADARIVGKTWAIKEMSDAAITNPLEKQQAHAAFRQEAQMLASLDHPNLPKVTDHFTEGGKQYLVMDFIEGETLTDCLDREGQLSLPVDTVIRYAEQLCDVLEYLHGQSPPVIFRDLKPGNVMVTADGTVKLIDFGIARIFKPGKAADTAYFGTTGYAPREQYGKGQTDARSDVYALGATLHHLLTGVDPIDHPFRFEDVRQLNPAVPAHVADAVTRALSDDPDDRWSGAVAMKAALTQQPTRGPLPGPRVSVGPQAAAAAAQVGKAAVPQPTPTAAPSRLAWLRGFGLTLLGAILQGGGAILANEIWWEYDLYPPAIFAFIPTTLGVLFGPWVGGLAGIAGPLIWGVVMEEFWPSLWIVALSHCLLGVLPALIVKDARKWASTLGASAVAGGLYALIVPALIGISEGWWDEFWKLSTRFLLASLPPLVILSPLLARWLIEPVSRRGLYWREPTTPDGPSNLNNDVR